MVRLLSQGPNQLRMLCQVKDHLCQKIGGCLNRRLSHDMKLLDSVLKESQRLKPLAMSTNLFLPSSRSRD
jgi:cytochrome P450